MPLTTKEIKSLTNALRHKRLSQADLDRVNVALRLWNMSRVYTLAEPKRERLEESIRITLASALAHSMARDQLVGPLKLLKDQMNYLRRIENRREEASHGRTLRTVFSSRVRPRANGVEPARNETA